MNEWSSKRKRIISSSIFSIVIFLIALPAFFLFYESPTCFDVKMNGGETGVDCGGSCQLLCSADSLKLLTKGDPRVIHVTGKYYEVVSVVENPNVTGEVKRAPYTIKLFEATSANPMRIIEGETYIPKGETFVVFEGPLDMGESKPTRATIEWDYGKFVWQKNTEPPADVEVRNVVLTKESTEPRIDAMLTNNSLDSLKNIEITAVVSEEKGNIVAASKTFVEKLSAGSVVPIVFTWTETFQTREDRCDFPVDIALVLDRSGSMSFLSNNPPQPFTDVKNTALSFLSQSGENDRHSLISFANDAKVDATLGSDRATVISAVNKMSIVTTSLQNTNIGAALNAARGELNSLRRREEADKAIVLLTDGVPTLPTKADDKNYPEVYTREAANMARQEGISIFTIGLGKDIDADLLRSIASSTAEAFFAPSTKELVGIYRQIATKICRKSPSRIDIHIRLLPDTSYLR